jgi:hypothetical protein
MSKSDKNQQIIEIYNRKTIEIYESIEEWDGNISEYLPHLWMGKTFKSFHAKAKEEDRLDLIKT